MSSTAESDSRATTMAEKAAPPGNGQRVQDWFLILLVFVSGAVSLAVELSASRLLAPYFGTSLFVWANVIGMILLYLTVGYYVGGRIADRYPRSSVLYGMTAAAALLIAAIPACSRPILQWALTSFSSYSIGVFYGSLLSVILLFALPTILLGCVSPFAIRLRIEQVGTSGRIAGVLYAISTAGSIVGTFLPVLVLIPTYGTYATFLIFAGLLLVVSLIGLLFFTGGKPSLPKSNKRFFLLLLILVWLLTGVLGTHGSIKPASGTGDGGRLLEEHESAYNYIQVVRAGDETQLVLNEGLGIHSIYNPHAVLTQGPWDYFMAAPYFNNPPFTPDQVKRVGIIGLGAGTSAREFTAAYGPIPIDGVEIDSKIVEMGRKYFHMNEPNLHVVVQDGRYFLSTTQNKYDVIGIDAYQQPYIPFQLVTTEFFREVRSHLSSTGVAVINVGRTSEDYRMVDAMAQNMKTIFPNVYIIDTQRFSNSLIIATNAPTKFENFRNNTNELTNPLLQQVANTALRYGSMREQLQSHVFFTDDLSPVEQMTDQVIFGEVNRLQK
ncbi:spermidine synthase [Ktedonobacter racemifer]|uniref:Spermine synthase n=1 Tax=Ktedonobacter racemifer DSM 44963 TaxID=485913 RepID=D6TGD2_KTERA|nr:fused MFS/spermidine synthase [Ktedonobacter racemifer]EFH90644.1 Spermine synthase [Ktedonobacter racemifer DSM 44963]